MVSQDYTIHVGSSLFSSLSSVNSSWLLAGCFIVLHVDAVFVFIVMLFSGGIHEPLMVLWIYS